MRAWAFGALCLCLAMAIWADAPAADAPADTFPQVWSWSAEGGAELGLGVDSAYGQAGSNAGSLNGGGIGRLELERISSGGLVLGAGILAAPHESFTVPHARKRDVYTWEASPFGLFLAPGRRFKLGHGWCLEGRLGIAALIESVTASDVPVQWWASQASGLGYGLAAQPELRLERLVDDKLGFGFNVGYAYAAYLVQYQSWYGPRPGSPLGYVYEPDPSANFNYQTNGLALTFFLNYYYSPMF
jgi:hypothetical protein